MKISIIHPSRERPEQAAATIAHWIGNATNPQDIEYFLSIDITDQKINDYQRLCTYPYFKISDNKTAIEAINTAAKETSGNLLIVVSDDFLCEPGWDVSLLAALEGKEDIIVKTDDGLQPWIITLPIMDRKYYDRFGYIYYPEYQHMFCDTEMTHVADLLSRKITLPLKFPHDHYSQKGNHPFDAVNKKNDSTWAQGEELYIKRAKENFGLTGALGALDCNSQYRDWFRRKGINV